MIKRRIEMTQEEKDVMYHRKGLHRKERNIFFTMALPESMMKKVMEMAEKESLTRQECVRRLVRKSLYGKAEN